MQRLREDGQRSARRHRRSEDRRGPTANPAHQRQARPLFAFPPELRQLARSVATPEAASCSEATRCRRCACWGSMPRSLATFSLAPNDWGSTPESWPKITSAERYEPYLLEWSWSSCHQRSTRLPSGAYGLRWATPSCTARRNASPTGNTPAILPFIEAASAYESRRSLAIVSSGSP